MEKFPGKPINSPAMYLWMKWKGKKNQQIGEATPKFQVWNPSRGRKGPTEGSEQELGGLCWDQHLQVRHSLPIPVPAPSGASEMPWMRLKAQDPPAGSSDSSSSVGRAAPTRVCSAWGVVSCSAPKNIPFSWVLSAVPGENPESVPCLLEFEDCSAWPGVWQR